MIVEQLSILIDLTLVLILAYFVIRFKNWKVALFLIVSTTVLASGGRQDSGKLIEVVRQMNLGFLAYLLYDYMKVIHDQRRYQFDRHMVAIIEGSHYAIIGIDLDGNIISWNTAATELYGFAEGQAKGKKINIIIPKHLQDQHENIMSVIKSGEIVDSELVERLQSNGRTVKVELTVWPVRDPISSKIIGASAISREVSDDKDTRKSI